MRLAFLVGNYTLGVLGRSFLANAQPWLKIIADDSHGAALDAPDFCSVCLGAATAPQSLQTAAHFQ
jgi:hypothetical protein